MTERALSLRFVEWVVRRRVVVLAVLSIVACLGFWHARKLETRFSPEEMIPSEVSGIGVAEIDPAWTEATPLVVTVEAPNVLDAAVLDHVGAVSRAARAWPHVDRVDSLTSASLPYVDSANDASLDDLERAAAPAIDPSMEHALADLASADPARFPLGLASLGERLGGAVRVGPLVDVDDTPDREAITRAVEHLRSLEGMLVSRDHRTALVIAQLPQHLSEDAHTHVVDAARQWLMQHPPPAGAHDTVTGLPAVRAALMTTLRHDVWRLVTLACLGSLLVLVLAFRSFPGVFIPMGVVGVSVGSVMGAMALLGEPLTLINNVIPPLLVSIGLSDAVHLVAHHREETARGVDRATAASTVGSTLAMPCFLTSATAAVGFGALVWSDTSMLQRFGVLAAVGTMYAYLVTMLFTPAALSMVVIRPPRVRGSRLERMLDRATSTVLAAPKVVLVASAVLFIGAAILASQVRFGATLLSNLDPGAEAVADAHRVEGVIGGIRTLDVAVVSNRGWLDVQGMTRLDHLRDRLSKIDSVGRVVSLPDVLRDAWSFVTSDPDAQRERWHTDDQVRALATLVGPKPISPHLSRDGRVAHFRVQVRDSDETKLARVIRDVEVATKATSDRYRIWGEAYRSSVGLRKVVDSLVGSFVLGAVMVFGLLVLSFRDVRLGLVSIVPTLLPLQLTAGYMTLRHIPLHAGTMIVFVVTVGLVVDGTIHILSRYQELGGLPRAERILRAMRESGRGVLIGAATLLLGFAALLGSAFVPIRYFGELSVVAVLGALLSEFIVLPALLWMLPERKR